MNRILGVIGSPRRLGNTHILVSEILEGARQKGAIVDQVFLNDLAIRECDGCHKCWKGKSCSKNDDMNPVYPRIMESDIIVFGTPVYWYGPTGIMKVFMDRFVYFNCPENRERIKGKSAIIVIPFEEQDLSAADLVVAFFEKSSGYLQMKIIDRLLVPGVTLKGEVKNKKEVMQKALEIGKSIA